MPKKMTDNNTNIRNLKIRVESFIEKRDWQQYHTPRNIAESICIEAAELLQIFQWTSDDASSASVGTPEKVRRISDELADVVIYCLSMANTMKIDVANAVSTKLESNEKKYPVGLWKGKAYIGQCVQT